MPEVEVIQPVSIRNQIIDDVRCTLDKYTRIHDEEPDDKYTE